MASLPTVGFIGLGAMGRPMVQRLHGAAYALVVFDAAAALAQEVAHSVGGRAAATPREVAQQADLVVTMLPTSAIVEQVLDGGDGLLAGLKPGTLLIDMSSGEPAHTRRLAARVQAAGGELVDAPVSGGVPRARTGDLAIMFGGAADTLERVRPLLLTMGSSVTHTGAVGTAHAMKALNNLVSAGGFLIGVEALIIGQSFGLDPALMVDVLNASTGMNNSTQKKFKQFVLSGAFNSGFGLDLMVKDIGIGVGLAQDSGTAAPFAERCRELWSEALEVLGDGRDHTEMARYSQALAQADLQNGGDNDAPGLASLRAR